MHYFIVVGTHDEKGQATLAGNKSVEKKEGQHTLVGARKAVGKESQEFDWNKYVVSCEFDITVKFECLALLLNKSLKKFLETARVQHRTNNPKSRVLFLVCFRDGYQQRRKKC